MPGALEIEINAAEWTALATVYLQPDERGRWNGTANAYLIASAPKLLKALKALTPPMPRADSLCHVGLVAQQDCVYCNRVRAAHEAIAEAEGRGEGVTMGNGIRPGTVGEQAGVFKGPELDDYLAVRAAKHRFGRAGCEIVKDGDHDVAADDAGSECAVTECRAAL